MKKQIWLSCLILVCGVAEVMAVSYGPQAKSSFGSPSGKNTQAAVKNNQPTAGKAQAAAGSNQVKPSLSFDGKTYYLEYSTGDNSLWLNEYLPAGENFNSYTTMLAVRSYDSSNATPVQIIAAVAASYAKKYPGRKADIFAKTPQDAWTWFIEQGSNVTELNLFRAVSVNGHPVTLQFVYREYGEKSVDNMERAIPTKYPRWKNAFLAMPVPAINKTVKK